MTGGPLATPLAGKLAERIRIDGPITIAEFVAACLGDPEHGYYLTLEPFGRGGDFVTAPEISQMFGELLGLWAIAVWEAMGAPTAFHLVELGPGRGTLMADALRAARLRPEFGAAAHIRLIETSPRLRAVQAVTLATVRPSWHASIETIPDGPAIVIANEFFDALPIHQFVRTGGGWAERMVGLADSGRLAFGLRPSRGPEWLDESRTIPAGDLGEGAVVEQAPASIAIVAGLAARVAVHGGAALLIDYGYSVPATGDTLQAVRRHAFDDPLAHPGEADLTAHVDFGALRRSAARAGALVYGPVGQGEFLESLGIRERAAALAAGKSAETATAIAAALRRLTHPDAMGTLFKVMAVAAPGLTVPGFDSAIATPEHSVR